MPVSLRTHAAAAAMVVGAILVLSACAGPATEAGPEQTETQQGQPDGDTDPAQDRVRTGPIAEYGGPAYGDQGEAEVIEPGEWCKTIVVFWGGSDPVPAGVTFTFDEAVPDEPGLEVAAGSCGSSGADVACIGLTVGADDSAVTCSIVVRPDADFVEGTTISFTGTLECPTSDACDAMAARDVDPGPPLVVTTPAGA